MLITWGNLIFAFFPVRQFSLSGIFPCQAIFPVRHFSLSGDFPCQAIFPVRHFPCQAFFPCLSRENPCHFCLSFLPVIFACHFCLSKNGCQKRQTPAGNFGCKKMPVEEKIPCVDRVRVFFLLESKKFQFYVFPNQNSANYQVKNLKRALRLI